MELIRPISRLLAVHIYALPDLCDVPLCRNMRHHLARSVPSSPRGWERKEMQRLSLLLLDGWEMIFLFLEREEVLILSGLVGRRMKAEASNPSQKNPSLESLPEVYGCSSYFPLSLCLALGPQVWKLHWREGNHIVQWHTRVVVVPESFISLKKKKRLCSFLLWFWHKKRRRKVCINWKRAAHACWNFRGSQRVAPKNFGGRLCMHLGFYGGSFFCLFLPVKIILQIKFSLVLECPNFWRSQFCDPFSPYPFPSSF